MPDELTSLEVGTPAQQFDAATGFLAALAYPESHSKRNRACLAMRAMMFRWARDVGRLTRTVAVAEAFALPPRNMGGSMRRLEDRIKRRLEAAEVFARLLLQFRPASDAEPYSLRAFQARRRIGPHYRGTWCLEVMHLAMALRALSMRWTDPRGFGVRTLLANPGWIVAALDSAESFAQLRRASNLPAALAGYRRAFLVRLIPSNPPSDFTTTPFV